RKGQLHVPLLATHLGVGWIAAGGPDSSQAAPLRSAGQRSGVPALDLRPVDHVPPRLEVRGPLVLVLEVVRVLPDVDAEQRYVALHVRRILVRRGIAGEACAVPDQPGPAAAEALHTAVVDRALERVERLEGVLDHRAQLAAGLASAVGAHDLPE